MPRDDDEDLSAPLDLGPDREVPPPGPGRPAGARPKAPPTAPPPARSFRWGVCGVDHAAGQLAAFPGATGVVRYVSSGVAYTPPPVPPTWRPVPSEPGRFELPWDGNPAAARTLHTLRLELEEAARAGRLTDRGHPLLRELDEVSLALAGSAAELHRSRWGVGLAQPDNVLIRTRDGRTGVALVDLGFTWRGAFGPPPWDDSPGRPDWVDAAAPYGWLWDATPARQQFADPDSGLFPPADLAADVRTLGRLLAWLISGQTSRDLPAVGGAGGPPPAWSVVSDAAGGRVASADVLEARLRASPLSGYFVPPTPAAGGGVGVGGAPRGGRWGRPVAALAVLLVAGTLAGLAYWNRNKTAPPGPGVTTPPITPVKPPVPDHDGDQFSAFDRAIKDRDLNAVFAALKRLLRAPPPGREAEVATRRAHAVDEWITAYNSALEVAADPARRLEAAGRLSGLESELKQLIDDRPATDPAQREKEQQCLDLVSARISEFGSPR